MPALRISTNGGEGKARSKPRVALGNTKTSGDVKTLNRRSSTNVDKAHMKARFFRDDNRTMESKMNSRSKETKIRGNENGSVLHVDLKEKSGEKRVRKKNDFRKGSQRSEMVNDKSLCRKRKTTSADPRIVEYTMVDGFHEKTIFKSKNPVSGSHLNRGEKKTSRGENGESDHTSRNSSTMGGRKFKGKELLDKNIRAGNVGEADKWKNLRKSILGNGTPKISDKIKTSLGAKKDLDQRTYAGGPVEKPRMKNDRVKKSLVNGSELTNVTPQPKKKKRVIKIDPSDASNKRLDDGVANNANQSKMKPEEKNNAEMSKNAQFRAICPSPSILSFVEENLLGRRRDIEIRRAGYNTQLSAPLDNIPFSTCSERKRIEVPVFRNKLEFFASAKMSSSFPSPVLPEIAFAGRSNVGKSSLLNALTRQWGVVRISDKPGLTQSINFFKLGPKLSLVDLPGYGFAYAKEEVKEAWEELVKEYVSTRVGLKRVCVLVDTKWGLKPRDLELIDLMERSQTKYQVVLTKTDLVFPIDVARRAMQIEENLKAKKSAVQPLMMVSSKTGAGIRSLRTLLANVARFVR